MIRFGTIVLSILVLISCPVWGQDADLELMNAKERIDFAKANQPLPSRVVVRDSAGKILRNFNLSFPVINGVIYSGLDYYKGRNGKIAEVVIRKPVAEDYELNRRLFDIEEELLRGSMQSVTINCQTTRETLSEVLTVETENRKNEKVVDVELDNVQEAKIIAFLQQCGTPMLQTAGADGIRVVYQVLLHARRKNQAKYKYVLDDFLKKGYLKKGTTESVDDRLLMAEGKPQRYGTQIIYDLKTGYHLYPVEDPATLNVRRASRGLPPMETYLSEREQFYGSEIDRTNFVPAALERGGSYKD